MPVRSAWAVELVDDSGQRFVPCERRRIGYVPQEGALFPHLSVGRNVAFGLARQDRHGGRVDELLELVGLAGLARRYPHQLSGGQQQRVALARALASQPEIVLLDEPFSSLDASLRASVRADVHDVLRLSGATSILVTHDQDEALSMADQVAILRGGVIAQINTPSTLVRAAPGRRAGPVPRRGQPRRGHAEGRNGADGAGRAGGGSPVGGRRAGTGTGGGSAPTVQVMVRPEQILLTSDTVADTGRCGIHLERGPQLRVLRPRCRRPGAARPRRPA